jgi:putative ABC transport system permease protein
MSSRWFRRFLRLFPSEFQADYGRDMERTFRAQHREARAAGARGLARLWLDTLFDVMRTAPREHLDQIAQDVRYAQRLFRTAPGFAAIAIVTLAIGIGANTAFFTIVDAVLLRPLPYPEPDRLVRVHETRVRDGLLQNAASVPNLLDWQQQSTAFEGMAAYRLRSLNVSGLGEPRYVDGARATPNFFQVLGVGPAMGRTFTLDEARHGSRVAVITNGFWQAQFAGDLEAVGATVDLDGEPYTIVGVLPATFEYQLNAEIWIPLGVFPGTNASRGSHNIQVLARLKRGRSIEDAQTELSAIAARLERLYPDTNTGWDVRLVSLHHSVVADVRPLTLILMGAVAFVLLAACANIGSMLIARAAGRGDEFAVRVALGANRTRLVRQLLTESLLLAAAGGSAGLALAAGLLAAARRFEAVDVPRLTGLALDARVLAATMALTIATGLLFGVAPALQVGRWEAGGRLRGAWRGRTPGAERRRMHAVLNVAQVALAVVLLAGAGLMTRTLMRLADIDPGFDARGVLAIDLSLSDARYPTDADAARFFERLVGRVRDVPGVLVAALVSDPPLTGGEGHWENGFEIVGRPPKPPGEMDFAYLRWATPDYFTVLGVPLLDGRMLGEADVIGRPLVLVVNESFARKFFPGQSAVGRDVVLSWRARVPRRIVGVVGNLRQTALERAAEPQMYVPFYQAPSGYGTLLVRSEGAEAAALAPAVRSAIRAVDPQQPVFNIRPLEADIAGYLAPRRVAMRALAAFAALTLALALVGIYAVLSYHVRERTREFGVRMALGAAAGDIVAMVVRQGMTPVAAGVFAGLCGAALLTHLLAGLLFEVAPLDAVTYAATTATLVTAALGACVIPARRATHVDPTTALRAE